MGLSGPRLPRLGEPSILAALTALAAIFRGSSLGR